MGEQYIHETLLMKTFFAICWLAFIGLVVIFVRDVWSDVKSSKDTE